MDQSEPRGFFRTHKPILRTVAVTVGTYLVSLVVSKLFFARGGLFPETSLLLVWFIAGALYTHFFEYLYHRFGLHKGIPLMSLKRSHLEHHEFFNGPNFQRRDEAALDNITAKWFIFPSLFTMHYAFALLFLPHNCLSILFLGIIIHFLAYELSHWGAHVKDNMVDRVLLQLPLIGRCRAWQIRHHRVHHEFPVYNFNFTVPALGDKLFRTLSPNELET